MVPVPTVYRDLQRDLDAMPVGFPATGSGVELRILRRLFSPVEAAVFLLLSMLPEPAGVIRRRLTAELSDIDLAALLSDMARRGLIREERRAGAEPHYGKLPFVIGIYEGQVDRLDSALARDLLEYFDTALGPAIRPRTTPQLRTVPVNRRIVPERGVASYEDIRAAVRRSPGPFGVMNCICRQARDLADQPCSQTRVRENCLTIGGAAQVMAEHGQARFITRERMLELLDEADREGLVLQPQNTRDPLFICCCCGCCCVSLRAGKTLPRPVEFFGANWRAVLDEARCSGCGTCVARCQMEAVALPAGTAVVDSDRCIGCGLCVTTCDQEALRLLPSGRPSRPPGGTTALYATIYRERFGTLPALSTAVRLAARRWLLRG